VSARVLLDTHALIWALSAPRRLPARVAKLLAEPDTDVHLSAASTWEIAIKAALGKIHADLPAIARAASEAQFDELPISVRHTVRLLSLPALHRDPFDRLLVAQALEEQLTLVTHDPLLARYPAPVLWA
jgi:PIN domain nuclease of toxin-antitoxin system